MAALLVSAAAMGAAHAQQQAGGWGRGAGMLRMADANGDGVVSRQEYQAATDARFARMDANGDGMLSPDERPGPGRRGMRGGDAPPPPPPSLPESSAGAAATAAPPPPPAPSAGPMTREQFRAAAMHRFEAADTNGDGRIDAAEMQAMAAHRGGFGGGMGRGDGGPPPPAGN